MKNIVLMILLFVFLTGCSTIRMSYQADVTAGDGRTGTYTLKKSYDIGGPHSAFCALTGIFLGGSCWFYLVMPTVNQNNQIRKDARQHLDKVFGKTSYEVQEQNVDRDSWSDLSEESKISFESAVSETKQEIKQSTKPEEPRSTEVKKDVKQDDQKEDSKQDQ